MQATGNSLANPSAELRYLITFLLPNALKVFGVATTALTAYKSTSTFLIDRSLSRKIIRLTDDTSVLVERINQLDRFAGESRSASTKDYRDQLEAQLTEQLKKLSAAKNRRDWRAYVRSKEPHSYTRWLLIFRPEGFSGLIIHVCYYLCLSASFSFIPANAIVSIGLLFLARYFGCIALRLKEVGNVIRVKSIQHPNTDLGFIRNVLLLFPSGEPHWPGRRMFYVSVAVLICFESLVMFSTAWLRVIVSSILLLGAIIFRTAALSMRAWNLVFSSGKYGTVSPPDLFAP